MSAPEWVWWGLLAAPPLAVLAMVLANLAAWPRGRVDGRFAEPVSVLIPARNEAANLERCMTAVLRESQTLAELLVYDDGSTDGTAAIVERLAREDGRVRLIRGGVLPAGWVGKPYACHRLAEEARGDVMVFLDADTVLELAGLARLASLFARFDAGVVTLGVRQTTGSFAERLVIPLLHLSYLAWLPLPLVWRSGDPRFLVANGQLLGVRRGAYRAAGGWSAVRAAVVDDMAFCREVKKSGGRVVFADGHETVRSRMYGSAREVWEGFSKNLYEGLGGRPAVLALVLALHGVIFVAPYAALLAALAGAAPLLGPSLVGVGANLAIRSALAARFRQPLEGILLHPLSVLALIAIAVNSFAWSRRDAIRWRGRVYPAAARRGAE